MEEELFSKNQLRRLIIPLIIENFLSIALGIADTMMVSHVGEEAVSGVSLVDMINVFILYIFTGLATGGAILSAQYIGKRNGKKACESASQIMFVLLVFSLLISAVILSVRKPLLTLLFGSIEEGVMKNAIRYLTYTAASYPFIALYSGATALFRSMGNSGISMRSSIVMNVINVVGNAVLIYVIPLGLDGASISTVFARFVGMVYLVIRICDKREQIHVELRHFKPDLHVIKKVMYIGIPTSIENSIFQAGKLLVVSLISTFGTEQIAANAVSNSLQAFACIPGQGIQIAMITVVGQCIGAGNREQTLYYSKRLLRLSGIFTAVASLAVIASMPLTLRLYNVSAEAIHYASILILIHCGFGAVLWSTAFVLPNALKAAGDVRFTMIVSMASMILVRIVCSYVLGGYFELGIIGVWIAMILDWVVRIIFFTTRYKSRKWLDHSLV